MYSSDLWQNVYSIKEWGKYPGEELIRFIAKNFYHVDNRKDIKILELGCGPGANLMYCAKEGFSVYGIDGAKNAVKKCIDALNKYCIGWNGEIKVGDIENAFFKNDYFDAFIDLESVYCNDIEKSIKIYKNAAKMLKKMVNFS